MPAVKIGPVRCRYTHRYAGCGQPAVDPGGLLLLCQTHVDLARQFLAALDRKATR